jgi:hypothetical protein
MDAFRPIGWSDNELASFWQEVSTTYCLKCNPVNGVRRGSWEWERHVVPEFDARQERDPAFPHNRKTGSSVENQLKFQR